MNPFDLRGPEFLLFYLVFGGIVLAVLHWMIRSGEPRDVAQDWHIEDPYEIAYLRAGAAEALRVAAVALMDRGLLKDAGDRVVAAPDAASYAQRPIEKEILAFFREPEETGKLFPALTDGPACRRYRDRLAERGLLLGDEAKSRRGMFLSGALGVLLLVAAIKIIVALGRGRHNVGFLIILAIAFAILGVLSIRAHRTAAGDSLVGTLKARFASLKARALQMHAGGATNELSFLVAAYGLGALPEGEFPYVKKLFPKAARADGTTSGGGCGSGGCGGGGGGGGGGGCGGGGCGGCGG